MKQDEWSTNNIRPIGRQLAEVGSKSLLLIIASVLSLGIVMTFCMCDMLVTFGAEAMIPIIQALTFFVEVGPLVTGLLFVGSVRSGIKAVVLKKLAQAATS